MVGALSGWVVRGVPAMGGLADGEGLRANCLLGVKAGGVVLLSLLTGFFRVLTPCKGVGGHFCLAGAGGLLGVKIFHPRCEGRKIVCSRVFWGRFVQTYLRGRFLPLRVQE